MVVVWNTDDGDDDDASSSSCSIMIFTLTYMAGMKYNNIGLLLLFYDLEEFAFLVAPADLEIFFGWWDPHVHPDFRPVVTQV